MKHSRSVSALTTFGPPQISASPGFLCCLSGCSKFSRCSGPTQRLAPASTLSLSASLEAPSSLLRNPPESCSASPPSLSRMSTGCVVSSSLSGLPSNDRGRVDYQAPDREDEVVGTGKDAKRTISIARRVRTRRDSPQATPALSATSQAHDSSRSCGNDPQRGRTRGRG